MELQCCFICQIIAEFLRGFKPKLGLIRTLTQINVPTQCVPF